MTVDELRALALSLPEATEEPHFDMTSFRVRRKIFATVPPDATAVHVFVAEDDVRAAVAEWPAWCEELWWGARLAGLRARLDAADRDPLRELLTDAWRRKAPARLVTAFDASPARRAQGAP